MDRRRLEELPLEELYEEARRLGIPPPTERIQCVDAVMSHMERSLGVHPPPLTYYGTSAQQRDSLVTTENQQRESLRQVDTANNDNPAVSTASEIPQSFVALLNEHMHQQRMVIQQLMESVGMGYNPSQASIPTLPTRPVLPRSPFTQDFRDNVSPRSTGTVLSSVSSPQAVKLLASQLPDFDGSEESDVDLWIQRIEHISRIHAVTNDVVLLAATSKLTKTARRWFEVAPVSTYESWINLKDNLTRRFRRTKSFKDIIEKVNQRNWMYNTESFQDYAMDKLTLMQRLCLSDADSIKYLISGISSRSLRGIATGLRSVSIDLFLDDMHQVLQSYNEGNKKPSVSINKTDKVKNAASKASSPLSNNKFDKEKDKEKDKFCVYCRSKGHLRADCYKLKRKEQQQSSSTGNSSNTVAVVEKNLPSSVAAAQPEEALSSVIAMVSHCGEKQLSIQDTVLKIVEFNCKPCELTALYDTGSPISFICPSIVKRYFNSLNDNMVSLPTNYKAVNGTPIEIIGSIQTNIRLESLPLFTGKINFLILKNECSSTSIILGQDYFKENDIY